MLLSMLRSFTIAVVVGACFINFATAAPATDNDLTRNKAIVQGFWRDVVIARNVDAAPRYLRPDYIQHNPHEPNGLIGFQSFFRDVFQHVPPGFTLEVVKTVAEGDMVVTYNHYSGTGSDGKTFQGTGFDMFRIQGGLIAEHWEQSEPEPQ
jgi:predicted SnoaL-like aldol condensation-catalyzing enzyme